MKNSWSEIIFTASLLKWSWPAPHSDYMRRKLDKVRKEISASVCVLNFQFFLLFLRADGRNQSRTAELKRRLTFSTFCLHRCLCRGKAHISSGRGGKVKRELCSPISSCFSSVCWFPLVFLYPFNMLNNSFDMHTCSPHLWIIKCYFGPLTVFNLVMFWIWLLQGLSKYSFHILTKNPPKLPKMQL